MVHAEKCGPGALLLASPSSDVCLGFNLLVATHFLSPFFRWMAQGHIQKMSPVEVALGTGAIAAGGR